MVLIDGGHMRRRRFITLLGGAAAASVSRPPAARAQQGDRLRRIGVLMSAPEDDPEGQARVAAFRAGLRAAGWQEGRNIRIDYRWAGGTADRVQAHAAELVALKPEAIMASAPQSVIALQQATRTIPIVFAQVSDPVGAGFVASLARPGGNVTGFALFEWAIGVKWLELLKQLAPDVARVTVMYYPVTPTGPGYFSAIEAGAPSLGVRAAAVAVRDAAEIARAISAGAPNSGLVVLPSPLTSHHRDLIIDLAARHRLPAVYPYRYFVTGGGLASYGVDNIDSHRRAASYVDRILKGEKPGDLPVQHPDRYSLVINLKTAKALGLEPPIALLARTDEVIE
jgi:putative ABC transport system substrate-binding protein